MSPVAAIAPTGHPRLGDRPRGQHGIGGAPAAREQHQTPALGDVGQQLVGGDLAAAGKDGQGRAIAAQRLGQVDHGGRFVAPSVAVHQHKMGVVRLQQSFAARMTWVGDQGPNRHADRGRRSPQAATPCP